MSEQQTATNENFPGPGYFVDDNSWSATGRAEYDLPLNEVYRVLRNVGRYRDVAIESLQKHPVPEE